MVRYAVGIVLTSKEEFVDGLDAKYETSLVKQVSGGVVPGLDGRHGIVPPSLSPLSASITIRGK